MSRQRLAGAPSRSLTTDTRFTQRRLTRLAVVGGVGSLHADIRLVTRPRPGATTLRDGPPGVD